MDIFEQAARKKLRFASNVVGDVTVEDLWDLPLTAKAGRPDLDSIARATFSDLKSIEEGSFVELRPDPRKDQLTLKLDIVKHVIAAKIAEREAAKTAAEKAERKRKLLEVLAAKKDQELLGKTREELEAEIVSL